MTERKTLWPIPWLCYLFHAWEKAWNTGANTYWRCRRCGSRGIIIPGGGYQPVDRHWLQTGEWEDYSRFRPTLETGIPRR